MPFKITGLPAASTIALTDLLELSHDPGGTPASQKMTLDQLGTLLNTPISGTGSPEGVQTGNPGRIYTDTAADSLWYKKTGTGNTGWIQLIA